MVQKYAKGASDVASYTINWDEDDWLGSDTISSSAWTAESGITIDSSSNTTTTTTAFVSGGTAGTNYTITNRVVTSGGVTKDRFLLILILSAAGYCTREDVKNYLPGQSNNNT